MPQLIKLATNWNLRQPRDCTVKTTTLNNNKFGKKELRPTRKNSEERTHMTNEPMAFNIDDLWYNWRSGRGHSVIFIIYQTKFIFFPAN